MEFHSIVLISDARPQRAVAALKSQRYGATDVSPKRGNSPNFKLVGGLNPSEKYESQLGWFFPIYGKIINVPNHQPVKVILIMKIMINQWME